MVKHVGHCEDLNCVKLGKGKKIMVFENSVQELKQVNPMKLFLAFCIASVSKQWHFFSKVKLRLLKMWSSKL